MALLCRQWNGEIASYRTRPPPLSGILSTTATRQQWSPYKDPESNLFTQEYVWPRTPRSFLEVTRIQNMTKLQELWCFSGQTWSNTLSRWWMHGSYSLQSYGIHIVFPMYFLGFDWNPMESPYGQRHKGDSRRGLCCCRLGNGSIDCALAMMPSAGVA